MNFAQPESSQSCFDGAFFRINFSRMTVVRTTVFLLLPLINNLFNVSLAFGQGKSTTKPSNAALQTIVIDAGHGGHDPGCIGSENQEKVITLAVARLLAEGIRLQHPQINVILTRDSDVFIPLYERANIANRNKANLFISIHCNAMPGGGPTTGSETYVMGLHTADHNLNVAKRENDAILLESNFERNYDYDLNSPEGHILLSMFQNAFLDQSIRFAEKVERHFATTAQRRSRGVKQAGFVVLKETTMPSVLIETGFLSNRGEEQFLATPEGQAQIAHAILMAFNEYKAELEGLPAPPPISATPVMTSSTVAAQSAPAATSPTPPPPASGRQSPTFANAAAGRPPITPAATPAPPPSENMPSWSGVTPATPAIRPMTHQGAPATVTPERPSSAATATDYGAEPAASTPAVANPGGPRWDAAPNRSPDATPASTPPTAATASDVQYGVQIAATTRPVPPNDPRWAGLGYAVELVEENQMFKYQIRRLPNLEAAQTAKQQLQQRGFTDAFVLAFRNGRRISIEEARQAAPARQ